MKLLIAKLSRENIEGERDGSLLVRLDQAEAREVRSLLVKEIKSGTRTVHGIRFLIGMHDDIDRGLAVMADLKTSAEQRHDPATQYMHWKDRP